MVEVAQYKEPKRTTEGERYMVELVVGGRAVRIPSGKIYSMESLIATCGIVISTNYPNVSGFNILTFDGETLLHEVHPTPLFMAAAPIIQQMTGQQPFRSAVPVVGTAKPGEVEKMFEDARAKQKLIQ